MGEALGDTWMREALAMFALGFRHMKLRIGRRPLVEELPAIEALVRAVPELIWMADGNGAYDETDATKLGRAMDDLGCLWLEEPVPTHDLPSYARLRQTLDIPLAGGESIETLEGATTAVMAGAYDIIQPDASICGGVGVVVDIAAMAAAPNSVVHG